MADETVGGNAVAEELKINAEEPITADPKDGEEVDPQASPEQGEEEHKPKKLGGWQRKQLKAEAERDYWRDVALENLAIKPKAEEKAEVKEDKRPRKEDFIVDKEAQTYDPDAYEEALLAWNRRETKRETLAELEQREQAKNQKTEQQKQLEAWEAKKVAARGKYDDFDDALTTPIKMTPAISEVLLTSDLGADLAYYLGTHPEEAQKISAMGPLQTALALGKIEAQLAQPEAAEKEEKPDPPPVSKAPAPITPVKKVAPVAQLDLNDPKVPWKDWVKAREAGLKKKG